MERSTGLPDAQPGGLGPDGFDHPQVVCPDRTCPPDAGRPDAALRTCADGLSIDPEDAELWFRKAVAHRRRGEPAEAERAWRRILSLRRPEKFASIDQGIYGHVTRRNLAALAMERGDVDEAQRLWCAVLAECPGDKEALKHLM